MHNLICDQSWLRPTIRFFKPIQFFESCAVLKEAYWRIYYGTTGSMVILVATQYMIWWLTRKTNNAIIHHIEYTSLPMTVTIWVPRVPQLPLRHKNRLSLMWRNLVVPRAEKSLNLAVSGPSTDMCSKTLCELLLYGRNWFWFIWTTWIYYY